MFKKFYIATCLVAKERLYDVIIYLGPAEPFCERCWEKMKDPHNEIFYFPSYYEEVMDVVFPEPPVCKLCGAKIYTEVLIDLSDLGSQSFGTGDEQVFRK